MKAQMYNVSYWVNETNPKNLKNNYLTLLKESGFNVEDVIEKHFNP